MINLNKIMSNDLWLIVIAPATAITVVGGAVLLGNHPVILSLMAILGMAALILPDLGISLKKATISVLRVVLGLTWAGIFLVLLIAFFHIMVIIIATVVGLFILSHFVIKYW
jgi:hypothetical protein